MKNTILKYGLMSGAVASLLMVGTAFYFRQSNSIEGGEVMGYAGILLSMLLVFAGLRAYRESAGGYITFGKALQVSLAIMFISCVCYVVTWMIVYKTLMPDFMDQYIQHALAKMKQSGASEAQIGAFNTQMEQYKEMYKNPLFMAALTFMEPLPVGLLVSVVSSLVLRKKQEAV